MEYRQLEKNLYLVWKEVGQTPLESLQVLLKETGHSKGTYAGRLDPMAEGLLLILVNDKVHEKEKYLGLDKTYTAEILLGLETDSWDLLGLVSGVNNNPQVGYKQLEDAIHNLQGMRVLPVPHLSSPKNAGKPSWWQFRFGRKHEPLQREMNFQKSKMINLQGVIGKEILNYATKNILRINGDFRQSEIIKTLQDTIEPDAEFILVEVETTVSSGTYIRSLAHQIGKETEMPAILFKLRRTAIGQYKWDSKD